MSDSEDKSDGWIDWAGGKPPVGMDVIVECRRRDNAYLSPEPAWVRGWAHKGKWFDIVAYRVVPAEQPETTVAQDMLTALREFDEALNQSAEPEKQPQPGEWCFIRSKNTNEEFVARFLNHKSDGTPVFECSTRELWQEVEVLRHLPDCTGFDYVPPPEQTPAEKLAEAIAADLFTEGGIDQKVDRLVMERNGKISGTGWSEKSVAKRIEKAIAAHMREEG